MLNLDQFINVKSKMSIGSILGCSLLTFFVGIAWSHLLVMISSWSNHTPSWFDAAFTHSLLILGVIGFSLLTKPILRHQGFSFDCGFLSILRVKPVELEQKEDHKTDRNHHGGDPKGRVSFILFILTLFFLMFVIFGPLVTRIIDSQEDSPPWEFQRALTYNWWFVIWVPLVEELVYRGLILGFYRKYYSDFIAIWFSSLFFALAHISIQDSTFSEMILDYASIPLGPFVLGVVCGYSYVWTGRIWNAILIHAVCNATVPIFLVIDPRWLEWFRFFYLG